MSGKVEPDHYTYDTLSRSIINKKIGAKSIRIKGNKNGGTVTVKEESGGRQALPDDKIHELVGLGLNCAEFFQSPQDIEWALSGGSLYLIQSRPVTSLFPMPEGYSAGSKIVKTELQAWFSFALWQGMLDPYTPAGLELFNGIAAGLGKKFGFNVGFNSQKFFLTVGGRLFINITSPLRNKTGEKYFLDSCNRLIPRVRKLLSLFLMIRASESGKAGLKSPINLV